MMNTTKEPRKDMNQVAKQVVDLSLEKLNKAADVYQSKKTVSKKGRKAK